MTNATSSFWRSPFKTILLAGFVAGTLDMLGALLVYVVILDKTTASKLLRGIASGVFKKEAFSGGKEMELYGILFHYIIAFAFTIFYFIIFPYISFLKKQRILSGLLYGIFVWCVMNLVILQVVLANPAPFKLKSALIGASILMVMIGLPLSFFANKYYENKVTAG